MANSLTAMSPTFWSRILGLKLYKKNVFRNIASFREEAVLKAGQTVDRPYRADIYVDAYTKGTAMTAQDITATSDTLTVNKIFSTYIYVDNVDKIQNIHSAVDAWSEEATTRLSNQIDADCLFQAAYEANDSVDYNDLDSAQTAGLPIVLTTSNVLNMFTVTARKLDVNNVAADNRFFCISPQVRQVLLTYLAGRESVLGDKTGEAGMIGKYMGFDLYVTNNLTAMIRWTPTDNPSNAETLVLNGVTITFETTPTTVTSGFAVDIGGDTETTLDSLTTMINTPTTDSASVGKPATGSYLAAIRRGWFAVDGDTYIDIYIKGGSTITASGTAQGTNTYLRQLNVAGEKGAVDLVIQKQPSVETGPAIAAGLSGTFVLPLTLYAAGVFYDMQARLFRVEVDTSVF